MLFLLLGTIQLQSQVAIGPIDPGPIDGLRPCAGIRVIEQVCNRDGSVTITFSVTNNSSSTVNLVNVLAGSTIVGTSTTPIPPYTTGSVVYTFNDAVPNTVQCFTLYLYNERGGCCHLEVCVRVRDCCELVTYANPTDAGCNSFGSAILVVLDGTPTYVGGWTNTTTGASGSFGPTNAVIFLTNLQPGNYTYYFIDRAGCRIAGTFTIGLDVRGDDCTDFEIHTNPSDFPGSGLHHIYDGTSEVTTTLNFCFTTVRAPDQLIVRVNGNIVIDSGPWSTLAFTNGGGNSTCPPGPWDLPQGAYTNSITVNPCDVIDIDVDAEVCNAGGVWWDLDVSCSRIECNNDDSSFLARGGSAEDDEASGRSDEINQGTAGSLKIFPNPVNDVLNIVNHDDKINYESVRVMDSSGKTMINENMSGRTNLQLDASNLPYGIYIIEVTADTGNRVVEKFVKL